MGLKVCKRAETRAVPCRHCLLLSRVPGTPRKPQRCLHQMGAGFRGRGSGEPSLQLPVPPWGARAPLSPDHRESGECEGHPPSGSLLVSDRAVTVTQLPKVVVFVKEENV